MSSAMLSFNHLACLADGLYQILTKTDHIFLTEKEQKELTFKFSKGNPLSIEQIYQKLYKLNKKAFEARYPDLLDDEAYLESVIEKPELPAKYTKFITEIKIPKNEDVVLDENYAHFNAALSCYLYQITGMGYEEKKTNILLKKLNDNLQRKLDVQDIKPKDTKWFL